MKPGRSVESVRVRRDLAQLLRRLRAIRREQLPHGEVVERVGVALTQAGSISRYVRFTRSEDAGSWRCRSCWSREAEQSLGSAGPPSAGATSRESGTLGAGCA